MHGVRNGHRRAALERLQHASANHLQNRILERDPDDSGASFLRGAEFLTPLPAKRRRAASGGGRAFGRVIRTRRASIKRATEHSGFAVRHVDLVHERRGRERALERCGFESEFIETRRLGRVRIGVNCSKISCSSYSQCSRGALSRARAPCFVSSSANQKID